MPKLMRLFNLVLGVFALLATTGAVVSPPIPGSAPRAFSTPLGEGGRGADLLQFTAAGGHVAGFEPDGFYLAASDHLLRVEFIGTAGVVPQAAPGAPDPKSPIPNLQSVTYPDLWPGVTLTYQGSGGPVKSLYHLDAGVAPGLIRLRYNAPAEILADGSLRLTYETGQMTESAPVAWQEIEGQHVPIAAAFVLLPSAGNTALVGFTVGGYNPRYPLIIDPTLVWNSFLGGNGADYGHAIAVDGSGNVYVAGKSNATWGSSPVRAYTGGVDTFVAKLNSSGSLLWNSFLGGSGTDYGYAVAVGGGNVYATGYSTATWGSPIESYSGGTDAFVAQLNSSTGALNWHSFVGSSGGTDEGRGVAVDGSSNVYVAGRSDVTWGTPVRAYTASYDAFVAQLDSGGNLTWNTFLGGSGGDEGYAIAVDGSNNLYVAGKSNISWGSPVRAHTASNDAFVAKLNSSTGALTWNSFVGGSGADGGTAIAVDGSSNVYVAGDSNATWGSPARAYTAGVDAFVAQLDSGGNLTWNTFLGSSVIDYGQGVAVDGSNNVYVAGYSNATWGSPTRAYTAGTDAFMAHLESNNGSLTWHSFLGGSGTDEGQGVAVDGSNNVYVAGYSNATWGSPIARAYTTGWDAFAVKIFSPAAINLSPPSLSFGEQEVGTTSATQTITVKNIGDAALIISNTTASGDYTLTSDCPLTPNNFIPDATCNIHVAFSPVAVGVRSGAITITDTASDSPQNVTLTGTGTPPPNIPLQAVEISGPITGALGTSYTFTATVSPITATNPISYSWYPEPDSGQGTAIATYRWTRGIGIKLIGVTATGITGSIDSDTHAITITPPTTAPGATNLSITPTAPQASDILTLTYTYENRGQEEDKAGTEIRWCRRSYPAGIFECQLQPALNNSLAVPTNTFKTPGEEWCATVRPKDVTGQYGVVSEPACVTIGGWAGTVPSRIENVTVTAYPTVSDPLTLDYDLVSFSQVGANNGLQPQADTVEIHWYREGILQTNHNNKTEIPVGNTYAGEIWEATVQATNGGIRGPVGHSGPLAINPTDNHRPESESVVILPGDATSNDNLKLYYEFKDVDASSDEDKIQSQIRWYRNGRLQPRFNQTDTVDSMYTRPGDEWYATVRPHDGKNYGAIFKSQSILIIEAAPEENTPPKAHHVQISPVHPGDNDNLNLTYIPLDADGDPEGDSMIRWYRCSTATACSAATETLEEMTAFSGSTTIPASATHVGEIWQASVTPKDARNYGATVWAPSVNILSERGNTPPAVINVYIASRQYGLELYYRFVDADDDSDAETTIIWTRNGTPFDNGDLFSLIDRNMTTIGQIWCASVTPDDGNPNGQGQTVTLTGSECITITASTFNNSPPEASNLTLQPTKLLTKETTANLIPNQTTLEFDYDYNDPDRDVEGNTKITWTRNTMHWQAFDGLTFIPAEFFTDRGDEWTVEVTPVDERQGGASRSIRPVPKTVFVNQLPTITSALIITSPIRFKPGEALRIQQDGFTDPDYDSSNQPGVRWFRNSQYVSGYDNADLPKGATRGGEVWYAEVTAYDGMEYGQQVITTNAVTITMDVVYIPAILKSYSAPTPPTPPPPPPSSICNSSNYYEDNDRYADACLLEFDRTYNAKPDDLYDVYQIDLPESSLIEIEINDYSPRFAGKIALYRQIIRENGTVTGELVAYFPVDQDHIKTDGTLKKKLERIGSYYIEIYTSAPKETDQQYDLKITHTPWYETFEQGYKRR